MVKKVIYRFLFSVSVKEEGSRSMFCVVCIAGDEYVNNGGITITDIEFLVITLEDKVLFIVFEE